MSIDSTTPLRSLLERFRAAARTNREAGTYFEELTIAFLRTEPAYKELYATLEPYAAWAERRGLDKRDAGIDLVAETVTGDVHAIQYKLFAADYRLQKSDIDSFFTASGKKPYVHRIIVSTTDLWSEHAEDALGGQQVPVTKIDLSALENSVVDWLMDRADAQGEEGPSATPTRRHPTSSIRGDVRRPRQADHGVRHRQDLHEPQARRVFTVGDIPLASYECVVNGKSAIEWVMERHAVTTIRPAAS